MNLEVQRECKPVEVASGTKANDENEKYGTDNRPKIFGSYKNMNKRRWGHTLSYAIYDLQVIGGAVANQR